MKNKSNNQKRSGVLLHITSLPNKYGIGTLGKNAYRFVDFLSECGFSFWEILPLGMTSVSNSPFQGLTAFGLNQYLIDFSLLMDEGLLTIRDLQGFNFGNNPRKVDYRKIFKNSNKILYRAYKRFDKTNKDYLALKQTEKYRYYAIYMTLKEKNDFKAWYDWELRDRYFSKEVEAEVLLDYNDRFSYYIFTQYIFLKQWKALKKYANEKNIDIIGEIPHFVGFDCDYVYVHPEYFVLDERQVMKDVVGFPPDDFQKAGQVWGNPLYNWNYMKNDDYSFWQERINQALELFDMVKINHFGGFYKCYAIPFRDRNGKKGKFVYGPGLKIFENFKNAPLFADDIGSLTRDVEEFVDNSGYPHVRTIVPALFKFKKTYERIFPSEIEENCLAYIGNHDYYPIRGRIEKLTHEELMNLILTLDDECKKLNIDFDNKQTGVSYLSKKIINILYASNAKYVSLTMQDILLQDEESRMNKPGETNDNQWTYRFLLSDITPKIKDNLLNLNVIYNRFLKK